MPTFSTSQNGSENIHLARWSRTHIACQKRLHPVKLLSAYDCRAELVIISAAPVIHASVQLFFQHTPKCGVTPVHAVCFPDITDSSPLGNCVFKILKSVLHNGCVFRYDFQPLLFIHTEAERNRKQRCRVQFCCQTPRLFFHRLCRLHSEQWTASH